MIIVDLLSLDSLADTCFSLSLHFAHLYYLIDCKYLLFHICCPCWMVHSKRLEV